MIFKIISMEAEQFREESFYDLKGILEDECDKNDHLYQTYEKSDEKKVMRKNLRDESNIISTITKKESKRNNKSERQLSNRKRIRRTRNKIMRERIA